MAVSGFAAGGGRDGGAGGRVCDPVVRRDGSVDLQRGLDGGDVPRGVGAVTRGAVDELHGRGDGDGWNRGEGFGDRDLLGADVLPGGGDGDERGATANDDQCCRNSRRHRTGDRSDPGHDHHRDRAIHGHRELVAGSQPIPRGRAGVHRDDNAYPESRVHIGWCRCELLYGSRWRTHKLSQFRGSNRDLSGHSPLGGRSTEFWVGVERSGRWDSYGLERSAGQSVHCDSIPM